ncbi:hypothetical protein KY330_05500 [Candidatus Woesearchaeota archaeon]|nr:hypothetical protein [Candidatus Woesearchaeota archaeon]
MAMEDLLAIGGLGAVLAGFGIAMIVIALAIYLYFAFALMYIAKKTKTPNAWLAFIPIANVYLMTQMAGLPALWTLIVLGVFIPWIGSFVLLGGITYFFWLIAEKIGKPGWWGLVVGLAPLVPIVGGIVSAVFLGIMAWGK